jgi:hypothetical protein
MKNLLAVLVTVALVGTWISWRIHRPTLLDGIALGMTSAEVDALHLGLEWHGSFAVWADGHQSMHVCLDDGGHVERVVTSNGGVLRTVGGEALALSSFGREEEQDIGSRVGGSARYHVYRTSQNEEVLAMPGSWSLARPGAGPFAPVFAIPPVGRMD